MELIPPKKQTVWRWPAVVNFSLGGMGAGLYLWGLLWSWFQGELPTPFVFKVGGPLLVALGLLSLTHEAGRPLRGYNLWRHVRRSWMSREAVAAGVFIPLAVLDWLLPTPLLQGVAGLAALFFMAAQGFIPYRGRAVTAWHVSHVPVLFVTSGPMTGFGLVAVLAAAGGFGVPVWLWWTGVFFVLANLGVWLHYLQRPDEEFQRAVTALRRPAAMLWVVGVGHLLPFVLLAVGGGAGAGGPGRLMALLAGAALLVGGTLQKAYLILEAGYLRAIAFGPVRPPRRASQAKAG
ncbi:MAG: DmsC/YnfH family molybdoenzyme membrane anchor subunit [Ardenticatenia bacterium]|nr:DmsC/YnfH family molybdoenzyme membrane anchor subunit [Ardenticatenia bacterium]